MMRSIIFSEADYISVQNHLWRDDYAEHGAILGVGVARTSGQLRLLVRKVLLVPDESFRPTKTGYHLDSRFISNACLTFEEEGLGYVSVHNHPLSDHRVEMSSPDFASNRRAFPITLNLVQGKPVASLVFGKRSAAGEIWEPNQSPFPLDFVRVIGTRIMNLHPYLEAKGLSSGKIEERFQRQSLMFGEAGQALLRCSTVGVVGLGGGGSVITQQLAHLGVGTIIGIDDDIIKKINLNRVAGSTPDDALKGTKKGVVIARLVKSIDPAVNFVHVDGDVTFQKVAESLLDCDFIFCATDNLLSRNVVNQLCYQFLIPGIQIGAKVEIDSVTGAVLNIHCNVRPMLPDTGCLSCHGTINPKALAKEVLTLEQRQAQKYMNEPEVENPSLITFNSFVASVAVTDFQMLITGLFPDVLDVLNLNHRMWLPLTREWLNVEHRRNPLCVICSRKVGSTFALGDRWERMPVKTDCQNGYFFKNHQESLNNSGI